MPSSPTVVVDEAPMSVTPPTTPPAPDITSFSRAPDKVVVTTTTSSLLPPTLSISSSEAATNDAREEMSGLTEIAGEGDVLTGSQDLDKIITVVLNRKPLKHIDAESNRLGDIHSANEQISASPESCLLIGGRDDSLELPESVHPPGQVEKRIPGPGDGVSGAELHQPPSRETVVSVCCLNYFVYAHWPVHIISHDLLLVIYTKTLTSSSCKLPLT
ncbi:unnamed protein product [Protopolystoma xenopodis]|uniref:Uncharacterized protein n=1 Tax=Protopolystoma xenopodis TaxID=117903 RepID=A0A448WKL2_9PLAT|nr:unnamed protein product [Protopolystoma xenopodis]